MRDHNPDNTNNHNELANKTNSVSSIDLGQEILDRGNLEEEDQDIKGITYYTQDGEIVTNKKRIAEYNRLMLNDIKHDMNVIDWDNPANRF